MTADRPAASPVTPMEHAIPFETIVVEKRGPACWVWLNSPAALNSLTLEMAHELEAAITAAEADPAVRSVVVTGAGRAFCAGADLAALHAHGGSIAAPLGDFLAELGRVFTRIEASPLPTIALVNGLALAGGLELVLCCDLVVAADSARFGDAHANYGLLPGGGGSIRLPRKIGPARAAWLMMTGEFLPAADMERAGLVSRIVPGDALVETAQSLVETLATKSSLGLARMKELAAIADGCSLEEGLRRELEIVADYATSHDLQEGLTAFAEKRQPEFTGQ